MQIHKGSTKYRDCGDVTPQNKTCSQTPFQNLTKKLSCYIEENI